MKSAFGTPSCYVYERSDGISDYNLEGVYAKPPAVVVSIFCISETLSFLHNISVSTVTDF